MQNIFIDVLPPWVETGLQPAFYDLESGTVLQQTARMYAKVRELTEAFNTFTENITNEVTTFEQNTNDEIERFEGVINDKVEEYIGKFNELHDYVHDYFDNLDVQEEINNKLDEMVEDGTLQNLINNYLEELEPALKPNKIFDYKMGCTSFWRGTSLDTMKTQCDNVLKYFSKMKMQIRLYFDTDNQEYHFDDNIDDQITAFKYYLDNGGTCAGVHFYQETRATIEQYITDYGANVVFGKYAEAVLELLNRLPFKSSVSRVWLFNEMGHTILNTTNKTPIIDCINEVKSAGYLVSIPIAYAEDINEIDRDILDDTNFYSLNCYPTEDFNGSKSTIKDVAERFSAQYRILQPFVQDKDLVITEFGCSSSWYSFSNPSQYQEDGNGKPISLMIEGFFQSEFMGKITDCFYWYYSDAYRYTPNTLLSVKNNTKVRYCE